MRKKTDLAMAVDLAWAAGFFEGEGCIFIHRVARKGRSDTYGVRLQVRNTDPTLLAELQRFYGGYIKPRQGATPTSKAVFELTIYSHAAFRFLKRILPYLHSRSKVDQANLAIKLQKSLLGTKKRGVFLEAATVARRESLRLQLKELKRKGTTQLSLFGGEK